MSETVATETREKLHIIEERAPQIQKWFEDRGGILVWPSVNLSNPGASWTTPATDAAGLPVTKPTWEAGNTPRLITDQADVIVDVPRLVKRFHVGIKRGSGFAVVLTDAATKRVRREVEHAGEGAWHEFDYFAQDVLIYAPLRQVPLSEWESPDSPARREADAVDSGK